MQSNWMRTLSLMCAASMLLMVAYGCAETVVEPDPSAVVDVQERFSRFNLAKREAESFVLFRDGPQAPAYADMRHLYDVLWRTCEMSREIGVTPVSRDEIFFAMGPPERIVDDEWGYTHQPTNLVRYMIWLEFGDRGLEGISEGASSLPGATVGELLEHEEKLRAED